MIKTLYAAAFLVSSATTPAQPTEPVDFRAVNPAMQSLVDIVLLKDEQVEYAYPTFDEKFCDLSAEKLKYDLTGTVKNTPWLEGGKAEIQGTSTYVADRTPGHTGVAVTLQATTRTDVMALIRYAGALALKKRQSTNPKFDARINAHLKRLAVARTLEEAHEILQSGGQIARELLSDQIQETETHLKACETQTCTDGHLSYLKEKLDGWKRIQAEAEKARIEMIDSKLVLTASSVDRLIYETDHPLKVGSSTLTFAPGTVSFENQSFNELTLEALNRLRKDFESKMVGVQNGQAESKDYVQARFREALIQFKKALRAGNIH